LPGAKNRRLQAGGSACTATAPPALPSRGEPLFSCAPSTTDFSHADSSGSFSCTASTADFNCSSSKDFSFSGFHDPLGD